MKQQLGEVTKAHAVITAARSQKGTGKDRKVLEKQDMALADDVNKLQMEKEKWQSHNKKAMALLPASSARILAKDLKKVTPKGKKSGKKKAAKKAVKKAK